MDVAATCPTCRKPVQQTGSNPNYSLRDVIGSLEVRCPKQKRDPQKLRLANHSNFEDLNKPRHDENMLWER